MHVVEGVCVDDVVVVAGAAMSQEGEGHCAKSFLRHIGEKGVLAQVVHDGNDPLRGQSTVRDGKDRVGGVVRVGGHGGRRVGRDASDVVPKQLKKNG